MAKLHWTDITREDVISAIHKFKKDNPEYPRPRSTFVLYEGEKLPAKHIRGMAYTEHYGVEISKNDFGGGMETVRFFERLGFETIYRDKNGSNQQATLANHAVSCELLKKEKPIKIVEPDISTEKDQKEQVRKNNINRDRIVIPSKQVIEQKNALQLILNQMFDGDVVCEKTYPWLKTPEVIENEYEKIYMALENYRGDKAFAKRNVVLRCDFAIEGKKLIIEYDERQHFSEARRIALDAYREIPVCFDREQWIRACEDVQAKDNTPKNRDEIRAYYDSTRDIECAKHGYRLVRIMHGQIDFEQSNAAELLARLLSEYMLETDRESVSEQPESNDYLKVCMYLQTNKVKSESYYQKHMEIVKKSDVDLVVFPECCYFPGVEELWELDCADVDDMDRIFDIVFEVSEYIGRAVVINSYDKYGCIFSVYANAFASEDDTECKIYIKHAMTDCSAFEFSDYPEAVKDGYFQPMKYKGYHIGMTICYDCNHSIFSRMYELSGGVDLIVNSTGGDVIYDKWYKYNKVRAIENSCYALVTMGGDGTTSHSKNYVYGFNPNGGELQPVNLNGSSLEQNVSGGLYVYEVAKDTGKACDDSKQLETTNKNWQLKIPAGNSQDLIDRADKITDAIYGLKVGSNHVIFCMVDGMDIMKPEKVLPLLYSPELRKYSNKKYIIINRHERVDPVFFKQKLSIVLKVRSMENFCAVLFETKEMSKCYQCGKNRTAQVLKAVDGIFEIDLDRTSGPEAIWRNKQGMKAAWRENFEWLVAYASALKV